MAQIVACGNSPANHAAVSPVNAPTSTTVMAVETPTVSARIRPRLKESANREFREADSPIWGSTPVGTANLLQIRNL